MNARFKMTVMLVGVAGNWNEEDCTARYKVRRALLKLCFLWASLVAQWLRVCPVVQGTQVRSLIRELRSHMLQGN